MPRNAGAIPRCYGVPVDLANLPQDEEVYRVLQQADTVEAILKDKKKILPCAAYLQGEYGIDGLYVGVPCKLGARGLEQIIEIKLTAEEDAALKKSADAVKELCAVIGV
jgi:malate/lactate dehydrogenase